VNEQQRKGDVVAVRGIDERRTGTVVSIQESQTK